MAYIVNDKELNRAIVFQYVPEIKERYTTKGNLFHRYEDKYGNWGVSFPQSMIEFLAENNKIHYISDNIWKFDEE